MEKYLPIQDFSNYEVSSFGNIRNVKTQRILKPQRAKRGGYLKIMLYENGKAHTITIHRAVAITHLDNPNLYPEVDHKDRNKLNNKVSNLQWVTKEDNIKNSNKGPYLIFDKNSDRYIVFFEKNKYEYETIDDAVCKFLSIIKI